MISEERFSLFDPQTMGGSALPDMSGNYIIVLRNLSSLPIKVRIFTTPILLSFEHNNEKYEVIYVGKSSKSLRIRDYQQHFLGTAGCSTVRKSLGCLLGFKLIPRDINSPQNGKTTFCESDERILTMWMRDHLLVFYYANDDYANVEKELIRIYNPPLNLQGNFNKINMEFRKELSALRRCKGKSGEIVRGNANGQKFNPICMSNKTKKRIAVLVILAIVMSILVIGKNTFPAQNSNGPSQVEAMTGVRTYLKQYYLKDPDSYQEISWDAFGKYNEEKNTYYALHKYRAKNSFGGYVVEEKLFVLDSDGNVLKVVNDMDEIINDN